MEATSSTHPCLSILLMCVAAALLLSIRPQSAAQRVPMRPAEMAARTNACVSMEVIVEGRELTQSEIDRDVWG